MPAHNNCPKYADNEKCPGYAGNKTCAHCDHNAAGYTPLSAPVEKNDKIRAAMDTILNIFKQDNLEVITRAVFTAPAGYEKPCDKWSFMNRIFMMCAGTEDARGYKQWQEVGRNVMKGSHAFSIFGPLMKKVVDEKGNEEMHLYGFKAIPVFRLEDTDGAPLPEMPKLNLEIPCEFSAIVRELNLTVKPSVFNGSTYGYFAPARQLISLSSPETEIFLHELSHAVDHKINAPLKGGQHNDQEVTAEFCAAVVGHMMGYKIPFGNCKQYIEGYSFRELMRQLNRCEKVIKFIVDRTTTTASRAPILSPAHTSISAFCEKAGEKAEA